MLPKKILKNYFLTEKASFLSENNNQYTFQIYPDTNRIEVKKAVESLFNVKVLKVNILWKQGKFKRSRNMKGKKGKTSDVKKAIVFLKKGDKIDVL